MTLPLRGAVADRIVGGILALLVTGAVVALSYVPYQVESGEDARLRLSWRFRATVEECREPSDAELAELPVHMRRSVVCERRVPPHRLRVEVDGRSVLDEVVRSAGAQQDRPLYVFREIPLEAGRHRVRILFGRVDGGGGGEAGGREHEEGSAAAPRELTLETTLDLGPREVGLISYDPGAGVLRRVEGPAPAGGS